LDAAQLTRLETYWHLIEVSAPQKSKIKKSISFGRSFITIFLQAEELSLNLGFLIDFVFLCVTSFLLKICTYGF
jgi:hypothetical protein